jgi:hypothetical protein
MFITVTGKVDVCQFEHEFGRRHHWDWRISMGCEVVVAGTWRTIVGSLPVRKEKDIIEEEKGACGGLMNRSNHDHLLSTALLEDSTPCSWAVLRRQEMIS